MSSVSLHLTLRHAAAARTEQLFSGTEGLLGGEWAVLFVCAAVTGAQAGAFRVELGRLGSRLSQRWRVVRPHSHNGQPQRSFFPYSAVHPASWLQGAPSAQDTHCAKASGCRLYSRILGVGQESHIVRPVTRAQGSLFLVLSIGRLGSFCSAWVDTVPRQGLWPLLAFDRRKQLWQQAGTAVGGLLQA